MQVTLMSKILGVVMDPINNIKPYKDTTLALLLAVQRRGWELMYMEQSHLALASGGWAWAGGAYKLSSAGLRDAWHLWRQCAQISAPSCCHVSARRCSGCVGHADAPVGGARAGQCGVRIHYALARPGQAGAGARSALRPGQPCDPRPWGVSCGLTRRSGVGFVWLLV